MKNKNNKKIKGNNKNETKAFEDFCSECCEGCGMCDDLRTAEDSVFEVYDILDDVLTDLLEAISDGRIEIRTYIVCPEEDELAMVPTEDRIEIPKRVVNECKKSVAKKTPAKAAKPKLTDKERKEILLLRKNGLSVKEIARRIHKRDGLVGKFLAGRVK
ncbi:MAG: helix-turn-helix domain-containing protein [Bacteroidales bacterium]|nr:helix-turn-helix domain-containing protein [Bacteroidales bacterium]